MEFSQLINSVILAVGVSGAYMLYKNQKFQAILQKVFVKIPNQQQLDNVPIQQMNSDEVNSKMKEILKSYSKQFQQSNILEKILPKKINESNIKSFLGKKQNNSFNQDHSSIQLAILDPIWDMINRGGKQIRPVLCGILAKSFGFQFEQIIEIAAFTEILHNASLIIDDIEDGSLKRRNKDTIHLIYGTDIAINSGNFSYFLPFNYLMNQGNFSDKQKVQIAQIYAEEMTQIHFGQGWDLVWHNSSKFKSFPSKDQYMQMVINKTGVLLRMMARFISIKFNLNEYKADILSNFCENIGAAFQIQDDLLNISDYAYTDSKGMTGEDIYEGKFTYMVIDFLENSDEQEQKQFLQILQSKTQDQNLISKSIEMMEKKGSIKKARDFANNIMLQSWNNINQILPNNEGKQELKLFCQYILSRTI